jgi:uncharacterized protein (DUF983 family)
MNIEKLQCPECREYTLIVCDTENNRQCKACGFSVLASQIFTVDAETAAKLLKRAS